MTIYQIIGLIGGIIIFGILFYAVHKINKVGFTADSEHKT
jgi:hypothetical protein